VASSKRPNPGKLFEEDFRNSVPPGVYCYRLKDAGGWSRSKDLRFTSSNDYDHLLFKSPRLFTLELKSVKERSWSFSSLRTNQREGLLRAWRDFAVSGVILNFRADNRTFFVPIDRLLEHELKSGKKSLNLAEAESIAEYEFLGELARTRYRYSVGHFVDHYCTRSA
jgi:penicillin-binding protein-related factor A (putative recombinase)